MHPKASLSPQNHAPPRPGHQLVPLGLGFLGVLWMNRSKKSERVLRERSAEPVMGHDDRSCDACRLIVG